MKRANYCAKGISRTARVNSGPHTVNGTHVFLINEKIRPLLKKRENMKENAITISKHCNAFAIVKQPKGYIVVCGINQVSPRSFKTIEEAENFIASKSWSMILNVFKTLYDYEQQKQKEMAENPKANS